MKNEKSTGYPVIYKDSSGNPLEASVTNRLPVSANMAPLDIVDEIPLFVPTGGNLIPRSSNNALSTGVTLSGVTVLKVQTIEDIGNPMALYADAVRATKICNLPLAGGIVEVSIADGTEIFIGALYDVDIDDANSFFMANLMG